MKQFMENANNFAIECNTHIKNLDNMKEFAINNFENFLNTMNELLDVEKDRLNSFSEDDELEEIDRTLINVFLQYPIFLSTLQTKDNITTAILEKTANFIQLTQATYALKMLGGLDDDSDS